MDSRDGLQLRLLTRCQAITASALGSYTFYHLQYMPLHAFHPLITSLYALRSKSYLIWSWVSDLIYSACAFCDATTMVNIFWKSS